MKQTQYLQLYKDPKIASFMSTERSQPLITVKRCYVQMTEDDLIAGLVLNQIVFWSTPNAQGEIPLQIERDGHVWLAKTRQDWFQECWITPIQVDRALAILKSKKLIEVALFKWRGAPTTHIRLIWENFIPAWEKIVTQNLQSKRRQRLPKTKRLKIVVKSSNPEFQETRNSENTEMDLQETLKPISTKPEDPIYKDLNKTFNEKESNNAPEKISLNSENVERIETGVDSSHSIPITETPTKPSEEKRVPPVDEKINERTTIQYDGLVITSDFKDSLQQILRDQARSSREKGLEIVRLISEDPWLNKSDQIPNVLLSEMRLGGALMPWRETDRSLATGGYSKAFIAHLEQSWRMRFKQEPGQSQVSAAIAHINRLETTVGGWTQLMAYWDEMQRLERKKNAPVRVRTLYSAEVNAALDAGEDLPDSVNKGITPEDFNEFQQQINEIVARNKLEQKKALNVQGKSAKKL